jgi:cyclohexanone monooxygenase
MPQLLDAGEPKPVPDVDAVIVGAGFAGMYLIYRLRQMGLSLKAFEVGTTVGGTWYWNRYPGARCDVISLEYCYSFSPELEQEWSWSQRYPAQSEILNYLNHVADRFDLRRDIQFETRVTAARFDERSGLWTVETDRGQILTARYCVMATGALSTPKLPDVPRIEKFRGKWYHTANWPHEDVDFTGKRVGVIGTGSSGVQLIPTISRQTAQTIVFQRTPNFSVPARNGPLDRAYEAWFKSHYPELREKARSGRPVGMGDPHPIDTPPEQRLAIYEKLWPLSGLETYGAFTDITLDKNSNALLANFIRSKIAETVKDARKADLLTPKDHFLGTKRICVDTNYYETFNSDSVDIVDLRTEPIVEIVPQGIKTAKRVIELDSIIFATGFDALVGALLNIDIRGKEGLSLSEKWADGPSTYLGLMSAGFPNLFMITAPGSPSVFGNVVVNIEQHVNFAAAIIERLDREHVMLIEPTPRAERAWMEHVSDLASRTLMPTAKSWYMWRKNPEDRGKFMPYIGGLAAYRHTCNDVLAENLRGFTLQKI